MIQHLGNLVLSSGVMGHVPIWNSYLRRHGVYVRQHFTMLHNMLMKLRVKDGTHQRLFVREMDLCIFVHQRFTAGHTFKIASIQEIVDLLEPFLVLSVNFSVPDSVAISPFNSHGQPRLKYEKPSRKILFSEY